MITDRVTVLDLQSDRVDRVTNQPTSSTSLPALLSALTASSWVAFLRSSLLTLRMASPTYSAFVLSAASPLKILLIRIGMLFSLPPAIERDGMQSTTTSDTQYKQHNPTNTHWISLFGKHSRHDNFCHVRTQIRTEN